LYDYGNTRLRARISRLQSTETLELLADLTSIDSFISALTKTPYKESIEIALTYARGDACVAEAMRRELADIVADLTRFFEGDARQKINLIFKRMDMLNIKAIFRGLSHDVHYDDITAAFSPLGTIPDAILVQLAKSKDVDDAISKTIVFQLPVSQPLLELKAKHQPLDSSEIDLALEKWYFQQLKHELTGNSEDSRLLREYFAIEADIVNLNIVLRVINSPQSFALLNGDLAHYLIEEGNISQKTLLSLANTFSVENAIQVLYSTQYKKPMQKAMERFTNTTLLSEIECQMRLYSLEWLAGLPKKYPLGIGVPLGYIGRKRSEITNLRWIAKGIQSGFEPRYVKENLERIT